MYNSTPPILFTHPSSASLTDASIRLAIKRISITTTTNTNTKEIAGSHLEEIFTEPLSQPATKTENLSAAAIPTINPMSENIATIIPRCNPLITAIMRNTSKAISMNI
jgi:hypothetical protein